MSSVLVEPPGGGEELCLFLLTAEGGEAGRRREVGCQWEGPQQERREVGCQSDPAPHRDAAVQVDLLEQLRHSASPAVLLQCLSVKPHGPEGGALLQHCSPGPTPTPTRTRTRTIKPAVRLSPDPPETRPGRRAPPSSLTPQNPPSRRRHRRRRHESPDSDVQDEEEQTDNVNATQDGDAASLSTPAATDSNSQDAHMQVKLESDSIMCDVCGKVMKSKSSLARHSFIHTGKKPFSCHLCELRFNRRDNLQYHLSHLHPDGAAKVEKRRTAQAWLCAACGKTFNCRSRLKAHEAVHSGVKPHRCDLCPKAYMRTNDLEHHRKSVHADGAGAEPRRPRSLLCHFCGKEFKCRSQLAAHVQMHTGERPHLCDVCGRKFTRKYQLTRHKILIHANRGEEHAALAHLPFACGICGKRVKTEALLATHMHIHTDNKPHRCGLCLRSFQRATCLKQHHLRVHLKVRVNTTPPPIAARSRKCAAQTKEFPCPICCKVFKFRSLLASHSSIHSEIRPFSCDLCPRAFRRLSHLKRHSEVVHAHGARLPESFVCHICGKDKKCRSQLDRHVIIHTGERPFACDLCDARFNRRGNLQQHRKRMHGVGRSPPPPEEAPPIVFDDDMMYKQEETVVAVDEVAENIDSTAINGSDAVQELVTS